MLRGLTTHREVDHAASRRDARRDRVRAFRGSVAHLPGSVDEFLRGKHEDTEREEARLERRALGILREKAASSASWMPPRC